MAATKKLVKKNATKTKKQPSAKREAVGAGTAVAKKAAVETPVMDRRTPADRRATPDRRKHNQPVAVERRSLQRREKVARRRQIDPTTCERDYSGEEVEFMNALDLYKRTSGRMFPTCSEILEVLRGLGYAKPAAELATSAVLAAAEPLTPTPLNLD